VKQDGKLTAWCAQHDETTFAPAPARNFRTGIASGNESVGLVRILMEIEHPSPEEVAAIEGAVAWFRAVAISGLKVDNSPGSDGKKDRACGGGPGGAPNLGAILRAWHEPADLHRPRQGDSLRLQRNRA